MYVQVLRRFARGLYFEVKIVNCCWPEQQNVRKFECPINKDIKNFQSSKNCEIFLSFRSTLCVQTSSLTKLSKMSKHVFWVKISSWILLVHISWISKFCCFFPGKLLFRWQFWQLDGFLVHQNIFSFFKKNSTFLASVVQLPNFWQKDEFYF